MNLVGHGLAYASETGGWVPTNTWLCFDWLHNTNVALNLGRCNVSITIGTVYACCTSIEFGAV